MKAIYHSPPVLCIVVEELGTGVMLEPVDGDEDSWFIVNYDDPALVIDPTDDEVAECATYDPDAEPRRLRDLDDLDDEYYEDEDDDDDFDRNRN